ncbi:protein tyrosine kinase [Polymorphobacter megasporae]|uniref:protein tyrosine kinase n=1 Tax=Glacieibacterium megasporae TaxID=2835787 RepID=UPI001C1DFCF3|nr:protein tyrosine kinase [Polymorphobacter megasporae]UAJ09334.1 protein tyrosine kinase [Polymorphobacter megasporae]
MNTIPTSLATTVSDGRIGADAPIRDALLRLGLLTDDEATRVAEHQAAQGVDFDQAALQLGFIGAEELDRARDQLVNSLALQEDVRRGVSDELVVLSDPVSAKAESIRLLRTQVIAQHIKPGRRAMAFVAPVDGVGCSYLVANLAAALSQVGTKTLLVDSNLRSPRIDQIFGLAANGPGLSSYLSLQVSRPERVIHANVLPNLSVITAGPPVSRPQELLSSTRFRDGMNMLLREYDIALFDTPAANSCADALTISSVIGYAVIVARRDKTFVGDVATLAGQLAAARSSVVGSVLSEF